MPNIRDTQTTLEILKILGCKVTKKSDKIIIDSRGMNKTEIPEDLMRQMLSSVFNNTEYILRGYERIERKLYLLGADIRVEK